MEEPESKEQESKSRTEIFAKTEGFGRTEKQIVEIRGRATAYVVRRFEWQAHKWISIGRWRKWRQDGEFHPDKTIMILSEDFEQLVLPALNKLYEK